MLIKHIQQYISIKLLKEDLRKLGVNFITAGIVGIFVNHLVGSSILTMFWAAIIITPIGIFTLMLGLLRRKK